MCSKSFKNKAKNLCRSYEKSRQYTDSKTLSAFLKVVCKANSGKYICVNENIYSYAEWIQHSYDDKKSINAEDISRLTTIYDDIVNPTIELQKKLVSNDYRLVQKIYPIADELALYALDLNPDAYNYLPFVSSSVATYYKKLKAEEINLTNIGMLSTLIGTDVKISIMDSQKSFHSQLKLLISDLKIKKIKIACGYCFASGLSLLGDLIQENLTAGTPFELYIGSLQNYDESVTDSLITGIDKATLRLLNQYLLFKNFELFTCPDRFYHGKLYIFEGEEFSVVIVGSSNLSRSAFISNYELNLAFRMPAGGVLFNNFLRWTNKLRYYSKKINMLEESRFGNNELKLDESVLIKRITATSMISKIRSLTNMLSIKLEASQRNCAMAVTVLCWRNKIKINKNSAFSNL